MKNNKDTFPILSHDADMCTSSKNRILLSRACFKGSVYKKDLEDIVDIIINRNFNNDYNKFMKILILRAPFELTLVKNKFFSITNESFLFS